MSASSTVSSRETGVAGCSWSTEAILAARGISISPPSGVRRPRISLNRVDLPMPFLPTSPTLVEGGRVTLARSKNLRPQPLKVRSVICSMRRIAQAALPAACGVDHAKVSVFPGRGWRRREVVDAVGIEPTTPAV